MKVVYSIAVTPPSLLLGESAIATLHCTADTETPTVFTFNHRSLVIEMNHDGLSEPDLAFPNRRAVEDRGRLVRLAAPGGIEQLAAGDERSRQVDLLALFPAALLRVGYIAVTYRLEEASPPVRPAPVAAEVMSGPDAIPLLIGHLGAEDSVVRALAALLLDQMTAQSFGEVVSGTPEERATIVDRWWYWWQGEGVTLPWNFDADGATFALTPPPAPSDRRSKRLGGIAYSGSRP